MKRSFSIMMALMLSLMVVYMSVVADGKNKPLSEEVSRTPQIVFLRKKWSKACREKSADAIVVQ